jgi:hypothetical protein
MSTPGIHVSGG